ncbi:helix-turn-helix domain-containing protein [Joostella atrarenae]|uniref:Helix-turn-helix domain-containing protein n=2 Tax=Joostella atrarenae TaxID=679257 RepID=A0ABS9J4Y5_9FLAO|nr:helix-turn-helix domain-containing protein [Joostella atrarenae]
MIRIAFKRILILKYEMLKNFSERLLTRQEVAELLRVSLVTIHNLKKRGILKPTHKVGRKPLYLESSILEQIALSNYRNVA